MSIIVMASSKGGAGKTTACIALASEAAKRGVSVSAIDADPNQHFYHWCSRVGIKQTIASRQDSIIHDMQAAKKLTDIVIVDLEGTTNMTMAYAICKANLVIIPTQASDLDGREVVKVAKFIRDQSNLLERHIQQRVLFTKVKEAIVTKIEKAMISDFSTAGLGILKTRLTERESLRNIISHNCLLHKLESFNKKNQASNQKTLGICRMFLEEVLAIVNGSPPNNEQESQSREQFVAS